MALKEDYKDDVFSGDRKYTITENQDNTFTITDATTYTQEGDVFSALDMNAITKAVNGLNSSSLKTLTTSWTLDSELNKYYQDIAITGITTANQIDVFPYVAELTKAQEEAYLEEYNKLNVNNATYNGGLRIYANEELTTGIQIELRLVK